MNFWEQRSVLVTGATGLLGSRMTEHLVSLNARVTCLVRDWVPDSRLLSGSRTGFNLVRGDLSDYEGLLRILNEYEIETVFHLGAQTIVGTASRSPLSTFESNIKGTWNLLEACRVVSPLVKRVIVASSDKAYGSHEKLPYTEDAPLQGRFPYDVSKSCTDLISLSYFHSYGLPVAVTRCGNLYGGGDLNFNRIVPGTILSALKDTSPVIRSDGKFVRDYFYVRDAVLSYVTLAEKMDDPTFHGEAYNFGTETPLSVLDLVAMIIKMMGKEELRPTILNQASNEILEQYLDCTKARTSLSWQPNFTMEEGLQEAIQWYSKWHQDTYSRNPSRGE